MTGVGPTSRPSGIATTGRVARELPVTSALLIRRELAQQWPLIVPCLKLIALRETQIDELGAFHTRSSPQQRADRAWKSAMDLTSPEMKEISDAAAILHQGDRERGRALLLQLWEKYSTTGKPHQICGLAHFLADTETDVTRELEWDLRALEAATGTRGAEDRGVLAPVPENFLPSLHMSVGNGYRRLGDFERARQHVLFAANHVGVLADDAYGNSVRTMLRRLQAALSTAQ